jgi:hypothetical protein
MTARMWSTDTEIERAPDGWYVEYFQPQTDTSEAVTILIGPFDSCEDAEGSAVGHERIELAIGSPADYQSIIQRVAGERR